MLKKGTLVPSFGTVNRCSHYGKQYENRLKKLKIELPCDPGVPVLGIYRETSKTLIRKGLCSPVFTAALFTVAKV